jgi:hypothetical protein
MTDRRFISGRDVLLLLVFFMIFFVFCFFFMSGMGDERGEKYASISVDGRVVDKIALNEDRQYTPAGRSAVRIAVRGGAVGFVHSDCPDKICIHSGFLSVPGQSAVCLPNRVVVSVAADKGDSLDGVTY